MTRWAIGSSIARIRHPVPYLHKAKQLLGAILCNDLEHRDTPGALCLPYNLQENPHPSLLRNRGGKAGDPIPGRRKTGSDGDGHSSDQQSEANTARSQITINIFVDAWGVSSRNKDKEKKRGDGYEPSGTVALRQTHGMGSGQKEPSRLPYLRTTNQLFSSTIQLRRCLGT